MKSLLVALALMPTLLAAEGISPTAQAPAQAAAAAARPVGAPPSAAPQALSPSAQPLPTAVATPLPTAVATPAPPPFDPATAAHAGFYVPFWSAALHLGASMPLGDLATWYSLGFGGQVDAIYHPADGVIIDAFVLTQSLPAIAPTGDANHIYLGTGSPMNVLGGGVKGGYTVYKLDQMSLSLLGGLGYASVTATQHDVVSPQGQWPLVWQASPGSAQAGLLLTAGLQVTYQIVPSLSLVLDLDYVTVNLGGGTSNTPQIGQPSVGVQYDFD